MGKQYKLINPKIDEHLAYIYGVLDGDGWIGKPGISLTVKDKDFAEFFKKECEVWAGKKCVWYEYEKKTGLFYIVRIYSIEVSKFLQKNKQTFYDYLLKADDRIIRRFLRGIFDSEGSVSFRRYPKKKGRWLSGYLRQIRCPNNKYELIGLVNKLLLKLNIENRVRQGKNGKTSFAPGKIYYEIIITSRENFILFTNLIGFSIRRKQEKLDKSISMYSPTYTHKEWTKREVDFLINNRKTKDIKSLSIDLKRKPTAVSSKLSKLKITIVKKWSNKEREYVINNVDIKKPKEIAVDLGRPLTSIYRNIEKIKGVNVDGN